MYVHGMTSSRLEAGSGGTAAITYGFRIVAPDRPGAGGSDWCPEHSLESWPGQALALMDRLGIERFAVMGCSAGAPHALALAAAAPQRVTSAVLLNMAGDSRDPAFGAVSPLLRLALRLIAFPPVRRRYLARVMRDPAGAITARGGPSWLGDAIAEGMRQGPAAASRDMEIVRHGGWPASPRRLLQPLHLFQGVDDPLIGYAHRLAADLPGARLTTIPGGHLDGWTADVWKAVADILLAQERPQADGQ
jgi:pimeloyl-ACP methyl ester carboxylesterase